MADHPDRCFALDGIRGIAAFAVLLFHCGLHLHAPWVAGHGSLAVDVFFAMSGFVVEQAYGEQLRTGWPVAAFARARVRRLYPLYAVGLVLGIANELVLVMLDPGAMPLAELGRAVLFGALLIPLVDGGSAQIFPLNPPSWSLFVEALANAGFAVLPRRGAIPAIVAVMTVAATLVGAAAVARLRLTYGGRPEVVWLDLARGGYGFGAGVLLGRLARRGGLEALPRVPAPLVFAALVALLLVPRGAWDAWLDPIAILFLCPGLVALGATSRTSPSVARWSARAGALSYPLYVVHAPLVDAAARLLPEGSTAPGLRAAALALAAAAALGLAAVLARRGGGSDKAASPAGAAAVPALGAVRARG